VAFGGESGHPIVETAPEGDIAKALIDVAAKVAMETSKLSATGPKRSSLLRTVD
jgi:ATP-binding protein involved in chromosome partitioning